MKYSHTVLAAISPSPNPVSASAIIGNPEDKDTSLMVLQNPSKVTNLYFLNIIFLFHFFALFIIILFFYPTSGTPEEAVTAAPDTYNPLNPLYKYRNM